MNRRAAKSRSSRRLLRWIFRKGNQCLTCRLDRDSRQGAYMLSLVPHWIGGQAFIERHLAGMSAFRRHAAIAEQLRGHGWTLDSYTSA